MFGPTSKTKMIMGIATLMVAITATLGAPASVSATHATVSAQTSFTPPNCVRYGSGRVELMTSLPASFSSPSQNAYLAVELWRARPNQIWQSAGWITQQGGGYWLRQTSGALRDHWWLTAQNQLVTMPTYLAPPTTTAYFYALRFYVQWDDGKYRDLWSPTSFLC